MKSVLLKFIYLQKCARSSMDRILDSGSDDGGSNPSGRTDKRVDISYKISTLFN